MTVAAHGVGGHRGRALPSGPVRYSAGMQLVTPVIPESVFLADTARVLGAVELSEDVVVMFGAVLRAESDTISVGARSNIQDNCVVHVDEGQPVSIGSEVTVGHAAVIHGATVGDRCLVGISSVMLNGSELGEGAWLAAGSLLTPGSVIPPWTLAAGTPARPVRELRDTEKAFQLEGVGNYLEYAAAYRDAGLGGR